MRRQRLEAGTKTDAIAELRALQVDHARGEPHHSAGARSDARRAGRRLRRLPRARIGDPDPKRRRSPRTVAHYTRSSTATSSRPSAAARRRTDRGRRRLPTARSTTLAATASGALAEHEDGHPDDPLRPLRFGSRPASSSGTSCATSTATTGPAPAPDGAALPDDAELAALLGGWATRSARSLPLAPTPVCGCPRRSASAGATSISTRARSTSRTSSARGLDGKPRALSAQDGSLPCDDPDAPCSGRELIAHRQRQRRKNIALGPAGRACLRDRERSPAVCAQCAPRRSQGGHRRRSQSSRSGACWTARSSSHARWSRLRERSDASRASVVARHKNPRVTAQVYAGLSEKSRERVWEKPQRQDSAR